MSISQSVSKQSLRPHWLALSGLSAVFLFGMLDNSILSVALPTIGREFHASATALQWITSAYAIVFGGLMLAIGAVSDRFGRRRVMLTGLVLLAVSSLLTVFVQSVGELIAVRALIGIAAAMTTPGTIALAFRLFDDDQLRIRAISVITAVGLVGLAAGPVAGGLLLAVLPWQGLLLINVPIAALAFLGIRAGIAPDREEDLHRVPIDVAGAILGTATVVLALVAPTLFVEAGAASSWPWVAIIAAIAAAAAFVWRERRATHPLLDAALIADRLVSGGLAYKAATGLAMAGLTYVISLQLQLAWGWSPALASLGMLPQVVTLLVVGFFVEKFVDRVGIYKAAWLGSLSVVAGMVIYATLGLHAYPWVALTLVLISAGLRVVGLVAGVNVMKGAPENRTSIAAAMVDTTDEITSAISTAIIGTVIAAMFVGDFTSGSWTAAQTAQFDHAATLSVSILTVIAALLITWAFRRTRGTTEATAPVERPDGLTVRSLTVRVQTMDERPGLDTPLQLMRWIGWAQRKGAEEWVRERELTQEQGFVLGYLQQSPGAIQRDIAAITRTSAASVSSLLRGLERRALIERRSDAGNGRTKRVFATPEGAALVAGFEDAMSALDDALLAPLDADERATLNRLLKKIAAELPQPTR